MLARLRLLLAPAQGAPLFACAALAIGLLAPAGALLCLALAAGFVLARGVRLDFSGLAGPAIGALAVGFIWGWDGAMGLLLVWRIGMDAHWSASEARRLMRARGAGVLRGTHLYATPALGLAMAAYTAPHVLLGLPLDLPHVPALVPTLAAIAACAALFDCAIRRLVEWRLGAFDAASTRAIAAHHALFLAAYVLTPDVSAGLIAMLVWRLVSAARQPGPAQPSFTAVP